MDEEKYKVLIVEDDPFLGKIMSNKLKVKYDVDKAVDGKIALEKIASNDYALILLDLIIPEKDGFDVLSQLKKSKKDVPVLVFSNLSQEQERERALSLGAKKFYIKSDIDINEVAEAVESFLENQN